LRKAWRRKEEGKELANEKRSHEAGGGAESAEREANQSTIRANIVESAEFLFFNVISTRIS